MTIVLLYVYTGDQCNMARVRSEMETYSDFDLHQICLNYPAYLSKLELPAEALYDSPKCCKLRDMLPTLIVSFLSPSYYIHEYLANDPSFTCYRRKVTAY